MKVHLPPTDYILREWIWRYLVVLERTLNYHFLPLCVYQLTDAGRGDGWLFMSVWEGYTVKIKKRSFGRDGGQSYIWLTASSFDLIFAHFRKYLKSVSWPSPLKNLRIVLIQEIISSFMNELEKLFNLTDPSTQKVNRIFSFRYGALCIYFVRPSFSKQHV
jgi:hypothetical protein